MAILGGILLLVALAVGVAILVGWHNHRHETQAESARSLARHVISARTARVTSNGDLRRQPGDPVRSSYRTKDGRADYRFSYERQSDGTWRAYILNQPGYGSRDEGAHPTHRLSDGARKYVCWSAPISTFEQAKNVSALWADATQG